MNWRRRILLGVLVVSTGGSLYADIISQALFSLPEQTGYVEYENLTLLRRLGNYSRLQQRFCGKSLQEVKAALGQLGIEEDQVNELVVASSSTDFYGVAAGTFSRQSVTDSAIQKGFTRKLLDGRAFCPGKATCVLFIGDSLAAFGTLSQLKEIIRARDGFAARLSSNSAVVSLLKNTDNQAPVRGVLFGEQLKTAISGMLKEWTGWNRDWSGISASIRDVAYSVTFDHEAQVTATLECRSTKAATVLLEALRLLEFSSQYLPRNTTSGMPLRNMRAFPSGNGVTFTANTPY